jgi:nucleolar protein 56
MSDTSGPADAAWFADVDWGDTEAVTEAITRGSADSPADWPALAVETGFADDESTYYERLHEATTTAMRTAVRERERADDRQVAHAVRAMDDVERVANELAERTSEWAGSLFDAEVGAGVTAVRSLADRDPASPVERRVVSLARRVDDLATERDELRGFVEAQMPTVAPNLAEMAGPVLGARLVALAGDLETLAKKPSGTVQVLGAEDALFAHLRGHAPSPKHGVIYTHDAVRNTRPADRGSAARALAGKLAIAARIDHYSGEFRPSIHEDLRERIETIRARADSAEGDR